MYIVVGANQHVRCGGCVISYTLKLFEISLYYNQALHPNYSEPVTPLIILKKSEQLKLIQPDLFK